MTDDTGVTKVGEGGAITEEEVLSTALPVAEVMVAAIMHGGTHRYVGTAFQTMFDTEYFGLFIERIVKEVTKALASGIPGFKVRHEMSKHLHQMEGAMHEEAGRLMLSVLPSMTADVSEELDSLMETARVIGEASRRLKLDFQETADSVVSEGKRRRVGHQLMQMAGAGKPPNEEPQAH